MRIVYRFGLHGNASVIHRTQSLAVRVIRPTVRLEVGGIQVLGCRLGAGTQASKAKIEEMSKPNHGLSLNSRNQIFCGVPRDRYTVFVHFYANIQPALTPKTDFSQFLTGFLKNLVLGSVCAKKFFKKL